MNKIKCQRCGKTLNPMIKISDDSDENSKKALIFYGFCEKCKLTFVGDIMEVNEYPESINELNILIKKRNKLIK